MRSNNNADLVSLLKDQYVIPGNIIYKQRGTLWHPGENTIMGRDHTIHAAVAGYVKYYRDPQRHPDRQYIGVVFNRNDKLPYPQDAPRKRKLGLVAMPRKVEEVEKPTVSASGLPLWVTRHETIEIPPPAVTTPAAAGKEVKGKGARVTASGAAAVPASSSSTISASSSNNGGSSVIAELIKEKLAARAEYNARQSALRKLQQQKMLARRGTRVLRLMNNYSYRETNWEIGRLIGDPGSVPGTEKIGSRKAKFRARRRRRNTFLLGIKERKLAKADRREEYRRRVREKREQRLVQRQEFLAKQREAKKAREAKEGGAAEKVEKKEVKAEKPAAAPKVEEKKAEKPKAPEVKKESKPKVEEKKPAAAAAAEKPKAEEKKKAAEPKKDSKTEKKE